MSEMVRETLHPTTNRQPRGEILRAIPVFLVQIPFVVGYSSGLSPIHPIVVMLPLVGLLNSKVEKRGPEGLGLTVVRPLCSLLLALLYAGLSFSGWLISLHLKGAQLRAPDLTPTSAWSILEPFVVGVFIIALWEEVINRGYIQTRLQTAWGFWGIVVTALLFAIMHIPSALLDYDHDLWKALLRFTQSGVAGFALGYVYWRARSVLTTIAIHGLNNFATGLFLFWTGVAAQEMLFDQPVVQLLWLSGQAGLTMLLARVFFDGRGEDSQDEHVVRDARRPSMDCHRRNTTTLLQTPTEGRSDYGADELL
jgi:membrane protease YdiL (CAAX protease family)